MNIFLFIKLKLKNIKNENYYMKVYSIYSHVYSKYATTMCFELISLQR